MKAYGVFFFCSMVLFLAVQSSQAADKILLTEGFDDISTLSPSGWVLLNHSEPLGSTGWSQSAFSSETVIRADWNNAVIGVSSTISNWLITPPFQLNGTTLSFLTAAASQAVYADRLEVRLSTNGASTDIGATSADVGDFSTVLLTINPNLLTNVYPQTLTEYILPIKQGGLGRVAFRYFITDTQNHANVVWIDSVEITQKFPWGMFLPALTGEPKVCSEDPQTIVWKGLEWQRCDNGEEFQWEAANNYCQNLYLGRHSDWRLPTKNELKNLVVCTNGHPVPMEDYHWCSYDGYSSNFASPTIDSSFQSRSTGYWTSTSFDSGHKWFVNFVGGNAEVHSLQNGNYVRCVRTP